MRLFFERATQFRTAHELIVYALPFAGLVLGWFYERFGQPIKAGNNLVIDTIHDEQLLDAAKRVGQHLADRG